MVIAFETVKRRREASSGSRLFRRLAPAQAGELILMSDMEQTLEELRGSLVRTGDPYERMALLNRLGTMLQLSSPRQALDLALEAQELAARFDEPAARAEGLRTAGICHEILSEFPAALEALNESLGIFRRLRDTLCCAAVLNNIGTVYYRMGDVANALKSYTRSLELSQDAGDSAGTAKVLGNIGLIHSDVGDLTRALDMLLRSLAIYQERGELSLVATVTTNLGRVYGRTGA